MTPYRFHLRKHIGPILLNDMDNFSKNASVNFNVKFLKEISIVVRNIYKLYFRKKCLNEDSRFISLKVEENMETLDKLFQDKNILSEKELDEFKKYTQICAEQTFKDELKSNEQLLDIENTFGDETSEYIKSSNDLNFEDFLNVVNNEIVESLLQLGSNKKYPEILKKINCILNNEDTLGDKLGKIKIILFIFNNEYLDIPYNYTLFKNDAFMYLKNISSKSTKQTDNIILNELRERLFDSLVYYNFKNTFNHNCEEDPEKLTLDIKNIEKQLDEIFTFIK